MSESDEARLRGEAMRFLTIRTHDGLNSITREELLDFRFDGQMFRLVDKTRGIRKPRELSSALSIMTTFRAPGADRPYEDEVATDGFLRYKWSGTDPKHMDNRGLREAMIRGVPLIWFYGVGVGRYQPIYPVYLVDEEPERHQFVVAIDSERDLYRADSPVEEALRRYIVAETKRRLHQPVFRATVMRAYDTRCSVCALGHSALLDAAHIVPDSHELGIASVRNGFALCKIHHAAYDASILGVSPDFVVEIRQDLLEEVDGPMLEHGLKGRHGKALMVLPEKKGEWPDRDLLEISYRRFQQAR
ncbi:HNH endonuclease [Rhodococcus electrodiphilus]|uniref:HNH endonuclease n=1 Tax=Rhodococcus ruber TaxID=1830 RepID=UPI0026F4709D|nr:HNH endonuclease [Rhodococcus ruber]MDO2378396.1 HNH endonuclease [Rhodococcus ruber]